jgi:CDP-2,3-bis-(O-geranylgeranyl)-sn-glycerol synthase
MIDWWIQFIKALWILLPAYAANGTPPLSKGKKPIDFNRNFIDGKRIFGDGKTIEGTSLGLATGFLVGALQTFGHPFLNSYAMKLGFYLPQMSLFIGFLIPLGALVGDMVASFVKRRLGLPRGANVPLLDQWNFVIGSVVFVIWFTEITAFMFLIMLLITPIVHRIANVIAYKIKIKREPW